MKRELIGLASLAMIAMQKRTPSGSAYMWEDVMVPLPSIDKQGITVSLLSFIDSQVERNKKLAQIFEEILLSSKYRIVEGKMTKDEFVQVFETVRNRGSMNTSFRLKDVAIVKTNFPDADFWIQTRGSRTSIGQVRREYGRNEYGKAAVYGTSKDIGIKVKPKFLDRIDPTYLSYVFDYYHKMRVWEMLSNSGTVMWNIPVDAVKNIPITFEQQGSANDNYLNYRAGQLTQGKRYNANEIAKIWGIETDRTIRTLYVMKKKGLIYQDGNLYYRS
jgi:hypothetical protein